MQQIYNFTKLGLLLTNIFIEKKQFQRRDFHCSVYSCLKALSPAIATALSFSTVLPDTPIPPARGPSEDLVRGTPPGKVIRTVRVLDAIKRPTRLRQSSYHVGIHLEECCCFCLLHGNIH